MPGALSPATSGSASARGPGEKRDARTPSPAPPAPGVPSAAVRIDEQIAEAPASQSNAAEKAPRRLVIRLGRPQRAQSADAPQPAGRGDARDDAPGASGNSLSGDDSAPAGGSASDSAGLPDGSRMISNEKDATIPTASAPEKTSPEPTQISQPIDDADWSAARGGDADSAREDASPAQAPRWTLDAPPGAPRVWLPRRAYAPFAPLFSRRAVLRAVSCAPGRPMVDVRLCASDMSPAAPALVQRALWGGFESGGDSPPIRPKSRSCMLYAASTNDGQWYTDDSDAAAVVAHVLGRVRADVCATFEVGSGRASYASVSRHGVVSRPWAGGRPHDGYSIRLVSVRRDTGTLGRKRRAAPRVGAHRAPAVTIRFCGRTRAPLRSTADLGAALAGALSAPVALVCPDGREVRISPAGGAHCRVATADGAVAHEGVPWAEIAWAPGGFAVRGEFFPVRGYRHVQ